MSASALAVPKAAGQQTTQFRSSSPPAERGRLWVHDLALVWQIWDAVIISVCGPHGVSALFTQHMQDGQRIGGLKIVNPFNPANADEVDSYLLI